MTTSEKFRPLNDYECMLATSTCNVGLGLILPPNEIIDAVDAIKNAWEQCRAHYTLLQVRFVADPGRMGVLGQRYHLERIKDTVTTKELFCVKHQANSAAEIPLSRDLQRIGTRSLDISKGSYFVECQVFVGSPASQNNTKQVRVVISLTHALSDGPGVLQVAHTFLTLVSAACQKNGRVDAIHEIEPQPLIDLQALLLGEDYAATETPIEVYQHLLEYQEKIKEAPTNWNSKSAYLPPEALQRMPSDSPRENGVIECIHFALSADETTALRNSCRGAGATIQGAISAAVLRSRVAALQMNDGQVRTIIDAAIQVPINGRRLARDKGGAPVVPDHCCLCGSAGIVHTAQVSLAAPALALAKQCTDSARSALAEQPREWLRRLLNDPASLPPYSIMASSIGVAPVERQYGMVQVKDCLFFGASLTTPPDSQGTMLHAVTFDERLQIMVNFQSPGIQKAFMEKATDLIKQELLSMISSELK